MPKRPTKLLSTFQAIMYISLGNLSKLRKPPFYKQATKAQEKNKDLFYSRK